MSKKNIKTALLATVLAGAMSTSALAAPYALINKETGKKLEVGEWSGNKIIENDFSGTPSRYKMEGNNENIHELSDIFKLMLEDGLTSEEAFDKLEADQK